MDKSQRSRQTREHSTLLFDVSVPNRSISKLDINDTFRVSITLKHMWLKSSNPIHSTFSLSYKYSPLGIVEKPVTCMATPDPSINYGDPKKICSIIYSDPWSEVVNGSQILAISQEPILKIEVAYLQDLRKGMAHFAFAEIRMEDIFSQILMSSENGCSELIGKANLIKVKSNRELGNVEFAVKVEKLPEKKTPSSSAKSVNMKDSSNIMSMRLEAQKSLDNWKKEEELKFLAQLKTKGEDLLGTLSRSSSVQDMQSKNWSNMKQTKPSSATTETENSERQRNKSTNNSAAHTGSNSPENIGDTFTVSSYPVNPVSDLDLEVSHLVKDSIAQNQVDFIHQEIARLIKERNEFLQIYPQSHEIIQCITKKLEVLSRHEC